jgi:hypothetical protein
MSLTNFPAELLLGVADHLEKQSDINNLARTCSRLHGVVNRYLYQVNVRFGKKEALMWGVMTGISGTLAHWVATNCADLLKTPEPPAAPTTEELVRLQYFYAISPIRASEALVYVINNNTQRLRKPACIYFQSAFPDGYANYDRSLRLLRSMGANPDPTGEFLYNATEFVAMGGQVTVDRLVLNHNRVAFRATYSKGTALHCAALRGDVAMIETLLRQGILPDVLDDLDKTPLHWAAEEASLEAVKALIKAGADVNASDRRLLTPLLCVSRNFWRDGSCGNAIDIINLLLDNGADVNARDNRGGTALHNILCTTSTASSALRGVRALIARGINTEIKDFGRRTALVTGLRWSKVDSGDLRELLARTSRRLSKIPRVRYEDLQEEANGPADDLPYQR